MPRIPIPRMQTYPGLLLAVLATLLAAAPGAPAKNRKPGVPVIRWQEGDREATLLKGDDGIYRYSLSYETLRITLSVDPSELQNTKFTPEHVFRLLLAVRNRGTVPVKFSPGGISLELASHFHVRMQAQDPHELAVRIQEDSDELIHQSERELKKHPERKERVDNRLREHEKLVTEWQEYLSTKALRGATLDSGQPETSGCLLFNTRTKWKGNWKRQEDFVLRIPLENVVIEFPFTLPPPGEAEPSLRKRN